MRVALKEGTMQKFLAFVIVYVIPATLIAYMAVWAMSAEILPSKSPRTATVITAKVNNGAYNEAAAICHKVGHGCQMSQ